MRPAHFAREIVNQLRIPDGVVVASMRPAHFAREIRFGPHRRWSNQRRFNEARAFCAGNYRWAQGGGLVRDQASMRPAHFAREIRGDAPADTAHRRAPMRPAHFAREIFPAQYGQTACRAGFNEASAFCAGNFEVHRHFLRVAVASMRPAHFAREIINFMPLTEANEGLQ